MTKHKCLKQGPIRPSSLVIPSTFVISLFGRLLLFSASPDLREDEMKFFRFHPQLSRRF